MAPDTAQLMTGPAPHSGPESLGIVWTLICSLERGSAADKPRTSWCPSPPIAGLQSYAIDDRLIRLIRYCTMTNRKKTDCDQIALVALFKRVTIVYHFWTKRDISDLLILWDQFALLISKKLAMRLKHLFVFRARHASYFYRCFTV